MSFHGPFIDKLIFTEDFNGGFLRFSVGNFLLKWKSARKWNRARDECHLDDIIWMLKVH